MSGMSDASVALGGAVPASPSELAAALLSLSIPPSPAIDFHPGFWLGATAIVWMMLAWQVMPLYALAANALWSGWRWIHRSKKDDSKREGLLGSAAATGEQPWGTRLQLAYATLSVSKRAYMRRLLRSFIYYIGAIIGGFYFLLSYYRSPIDFYLLYTPAMEIAFCAAATHFLWCCIEDWPCRSHMGRTKREQLVVFWGYIVHHLLTAAAYLSVVQSHEMASMCLMGLTFEGPVLFGCLREVVSLFDEDFDLFNRIPPKLLKINWILAFSSLIPCRFVSICFFFYSATYWNTNLRYISLQMQLSYYGFGILFLLINLYFTWLLTFWYRQDQRYMAKKKSKQIKQQQQIQQQNEGRSGEQVETQQQRLPTRQQPSSLLQASGPSALLANLAASPPSQSYRYEPSGSQQPSKSITWQPLQQVVTR